jgi:hypothetical protein
MKKILLLLISLVLISCSDSDEFAGLNFDRNTFEKNRELWEVNKISNYTFSQEYSSTAVGSQPRLTSVVINNKLDTIFVQSKYTTNNSMGELTYYGTVDDIYIYIEYMANYLEGEINSNQSIMKGAEIEIIYDDTWHYPTEIKCSGYYDHDLIGGLGLNIIFSDFEVNQ